MLYIKFMERKESTYPIPERDFGLLMGFVGALNPADRDVLYKRLGYHPFEVLTDSPLAIFWSKIAAMGLAQSAPVQEKGHVGYQLTSQGFEALSLTQAYTFIADDWPHKKAVIGNDTIQILEKYVIANDPKAETKLGKLYLDGHGVEKDSAKAFQLFSKAFAKREASAARYLGSMHLKGEFVAKNIEEAVNLMGNAASLGDSEAMVALYLLYNGGDGVKEDKRRGLEYLQRAVLAGNGDAMCHLGILYASGSLGYKDGMKAYTLLTLAIAHGVNPGELRADVARRLDPIEWQIGDEIFELCMKHKKFSPELI